MPARMSITLPAALLIAWKVFRIQLNILKQNNQWSTNAPLLSDVISQGLLEYRVAIETYLENYLNYYVVGDMKRSSFGG